MPGFFINFITPDKHHVYRPILPPLPFTPSQISHFPSSVAFSSIMTVHSHELFIVSSHPLVVVSGITRQGAADAAVAFGARCLMFDFIPESTHCLSAERAADIVSANVGRMGYFTAQNIDKIPQIMRRARLDYACLSGACEPQVAAHTLGVQRIVRHVPASADMQRELDAWGPYCAAFRITTGHAPRAARLLISRPQLRTDAGLADGVELLSGANLLREVLAVQSAT